MCALVDYLAERANLPRSVTIYNPVSDRAFKAELGSDQQDDVVVFAGRLVAEKGLDVLLHAVAMMPSVRLRIAGDGPMRVGVATAGSRDRGGRPSRVSGRQVLAELGELYAEAAVVCVPSCLARAIRLCSRGSDGYGPGSGGYAERCAAGTAGRWPGFCGGRTHSRGLG